MKTETQKPTQRTDNQVGQTGASPLNLVATKKDYTHQDEDLSTQKDLDTDPELAEELAHDYEVEQMERDEELRQALEDQEGGDDV